MTPVPSSPVALLDQLDELRAKATPGPWEQNETWTRWVDEDNGSLIAEAQSPADAALIVAAVNAVGPLAAAVRAVESIARVWDACADTWQENADLAKSPEMREACLVEMRDFRDRARVLTAALSVTP